MERRLHSPAGMSRLRVRRRPDGVVELNRLRARDAILHPAYAVLLGLFATWVLMVGALTTAVIEWPDLPFGVAAVLPCLALGLWGARAARTARLAPAPVDDPKPPRRVA
jgi:hypothetical protein